ncbi:MAG: glutamate-5-semialdehyde dehydrogenase [Clostridia bacterium]|nr:glutamate-5-semialdehyde dehydrogenase [Clostridia bacterium]
MTTLEILKTTKSAWRDLNRADTQTKNVILNAMADALVENTTEIIAQNKVDMENAKGTISDVMLDRLMLDEKRISAMADGIRDIAKLPDPTGEVITEVTRPNGMTIYKKRVPIGVVAIIYESRPNVTSDAAALSVKSGNVCVLRGGKEAFNTSNAIVNALKKGIAKTGMNPDIINLVQDTTRQSATELMKANGLVDLLIPRGGAGLIKACVENATVPCIQTGTGICHIYIDKCADLEKAITIVNNAKTSRPSVCNAQEVCLVHKDVADKFLPLLKAKLVDDRKANNLIPVELRLCEKAAGYIEGTLAGENDFDTEFLDYILAVKIVDNEDEAISHILAHSTGHSEGIVTEDEATAEKFVCETDSAAVYVNVSTRFTDGGEFGLGCEMGISTQKLHARGPMGIEELTTYKYIIKGNGQIR